MPKSKPNTIEDLSSIATAQHYRIALLVSIVLTLIALFILPDARQAVTRVPAFLPIYTALAFFADLMTAYLLFGQFMSTRTIALGVLAATYYYSSLAILSYILTFPGVFSSTGLFNANPQTAIWLFVCWHAGFPCGVFIYMLLDQHYGTRQIPPCKARTLLLCFLLGVPLLVTLFSILAIDPSHRLPPPILIEDTVYTPNFSIILGLIAGVATTIAGISICLRLRRLTVVQLWLGVTILATFFELVLTIYANRRYALGWYLGRLNSLWAAIIVLSILLFEVNRLYAKLARQNIELNNKNVELIKINKRQKGLVSVVSHEFRGALTSIMGFSDLMRGVECSPEEIQEFATIIHSDAQRTTRLINDMLDLSRMESGQMKFTLESIDLNTIIEETVARARPNIPHPIQLRLDTILPLLTGDADKLIQVVTNLLSNASKYSPDGGSIIVTSERLDGFFHLSIQDHGIGIPQDKLKQIFEPYSRIASDDTRAISGTGLGLSIVHEIITMHGGKIWVESQSGEGSLFHIMLPFAVKASPEIERTREDLLPR
ncbi:MAG TPA: MASE4 domain-containing protein [Ktedonobacteraceae bacterium]|nr:MASE4 domain-containing protein [Ktedonobacteraceae bacterium]